MCDHSRQRKRWLAAILFAGSAGLCAAVTVTIPTPMGTFTLDVPHVGPEGALVQATQPQPTGFLPPTIFSAPLPAGSGARALGAAGAFTALADDATAASWNPAGLTQLERPEISYVLRYSSESQQHFSPQDDFRVGENHSDRFALNYFSVTYPLHGWGRNWAISLNYQETYDFNQTFSADGRRGPGFQKEDSQEGVFHDVVTREWHTEEVDMIFREYLTTHMQSSLSQIVGEGLDAQLAFEQSGIIDSISPALAVDLTPKLSVGVAVNLYRDGFLGQPGIRSTIRSDYSGYSDSRHTTVTRRETSGTLAFEGTAHFPPRDDYPYPTHTSFSGESPIEPFSETTTHSSRETVYTEGHYEEINEFFDMSGINATFGLLWAPLPQLLLGAAVDLPWTAGGHLRKTIQNTETTYNSAKTRVLDARNLSETQERAVDFDFPLSWTAGATVKWNNRFYNMINIRQTLWSDFAFQAEGEPKINPLNGAPHGEDPVDDCWTASLAGEYLLVFPTTEIPLRAGLGWEQRPAIGSPDEYWNASLGAGLSIGRGNFKCVLDIAYIYTWANDVMKTLVPQQSDLSTDVEEHQVFVSNIWHF